MPKIGKKYIGTNHSIKFQSLANDYFDNEGVLLQQSYDSFEDFIKKAYETDSDFRCYDDALSYVLEIREKNKRITKFDFKYPKDDDLKGLLETEFFPYQCKGVLFAAKVGRSLIADEMGLGKTIQAIGAAELLKKENDISSILIICPTSLKYQWQSEIERFTHSSVRVIEGMPNIRAEQYGGDQSYKIVSYHTVANDLKYINDK